MPSTTLYFAHLHPQWHDWVQIVNIGNEQAKLTAIGRNNKGEIVWTDEGETSPFETWTPKVDKPKVDISLEVKSDGEPIVGERHCHKDTQVLDLPGASEFGRTVGRRMFFPELAAGASDWFRFLNVGEADAHISFVVREVKTAKVIVQRSHSVKPWGWWQVGDKAMGGAVQGVVEVVSSQPIVGERHLHYKGGKVAIAQLGQVIEE